MERKGLPAEHCIQFSYYVHGTYPPPGYFLLADGGYPCLEEPLALITPYKRPVRGMAEQRFNYHHSRGRTIIERAFGMMKTRFRCIFLEALEVHPVFVPKVINHCNIYIIFFLSNHNTLLKTTAKVTLHLLCSCFFHI